MNDIRQSASIHAADYLTVRSDLLHMVNQLNITYGASWTLRRVSWIRNGEDIAL